MIAPDLTCETLRVDLGERSYDIMIGPHLLGFVGKYADLLSKSKKVAVITDETVFGHYGERLRKALDEKKMESHFIIRAPGEAQKSISNLEDILNQLFRAGLNRTDCVIAFGGGVIGDLAGFTASIFKRGIPFIQVPTTLLAQVDSSVGGKTAINNKFGKNLIGAFYQPERVMIDIGLLKTLPDRELKAGYAEILKYGLLGDAAFFEALDAGLGEKILKLDKTALTQAILKSCETKARIVALDERETGVRALLNLGHTFGHALELEAGYAGDLLHGEAVSVGMEMAFHFAAQQGLCPQGDAVRVSAHLEKTDMPQIGDVKHLLSDTEALMRHMGQDKKNEGDALTLILPRAIGETYVEKHADQGAVRQFLSGLKAPS